MVDLETIIASASMTYIINLDAYECHWGMEKSLVTLLMNARVLRYTYMIRVDCHSKISLYTYVNDYL